MLENWKWSYKKFKPISRKAREDFRKGNSIVFALCALLEEGNITYD